MNKETIYYIYKIENTVNQKCYIGFTKNITHRFRSHLSASKSSKKPLYRAMRKYGLESFKLEVLYCSKDVHHCGEMEAFFIDAFDSMICSRGYNLQPGGLSNYVNTRQTRMRKSKGVKEYRRKNPGVYSGKLNPNFGNRWTDDMKSRMSNLKRGTCHTSLEQRKEHSVRMTGEGNPFFGKKYSESSKERMGKSGTPVTINGITYRSISFAEKQLGVKSGMLYHVIKGKYLHLSSKYSIYSIEYRGIKIL